MYVCICMYLYLVYMLKCMLPAALSSDAILELGLMIWAAGAVELSVLFGSDAFTSLQAFGDFEPRAWGLGRTCCIGV